MAEAKRKSYSELIKLPTFMERFRYLKLQGRVAEETFGIDRYINQKLYHSKEWYNVCNRVLIRDHGCDLAMDGRDIFDQPLIHHINPISLKDILERSPEVFNLENLITVSKSTHNAIHYGDESLMQMDIQERRPNDTCPWKAPTASSGR